MKTVQSSYLHLSNILSSQVEFSNRVIESSFSTRLECSDSTSQLDSTLFQKNFNSTSHDQFKWWEKKRSLTLYRWSCWIYRLREIEEWWWFNHLLNFLFNSWDVLESLNSRSNELSIRIWWLLHHHKRFSISSIMIIMFNQCLLSRLIILLVAVIVVKSQIVTSLTFIIILTQSSINFIILWLSLSITARSRLMI